MKKIVSIALVLVMALSLVALTSCGNTTTARLGLGVWHTAGATTDFEAADGETDAKNGATTAAYTACVMTVDADGTILACKFDAFDAKLEYNGAGEGAVENLTSKYDLGNDYNMKLYGGAALEWYEQADKLATLLVGKNDAGLMALVTDTGYGNTEVTTAGCTIAITDFIKAAKAAYDNALLATEFEGGEVALTVTSTKAITNATADANGTASVTTVFTATCGTKQATASYTSSVSFTAAGVAGSDSVTIAKN